MERHELFDAMLDECHESVMIAGITFYPSDILAECDPIAYRVAFNDWTDANCSDGLHEYTESDFVCDFCGLHKEGEDE